MLLTSCNKIVGEGPIINETRAITGFTGIDLRCSANVYFKQDSVFKVQLSAQQNILNVMQTSVQANNLIISFRDDVNVKTSEPVIVQVSMPVISTLRISGSGNINSAEQFTTPELALDISGSGNIFLTGVNTNKIKANTSGSGNTNINSGTIKEEKLTISGSGNIHTEKIAVEKAITTISGSGNIFVNVTQELNATISGSGSVFYKGNPVLHIINSGSGKVKVL